MRAYIQLMPTALVKNGKAMQNLTFGPMFFLTLKLHCALPIKMCQIIQIGNVIYHMSKNTDMV